MIKILTGIDSQEKSQFLIEEIGHKYHKREKAITIIVPEQYTLNMERKLLSTLNLNGLMGMEVMSFSRMINKIQKELILDDINPLTTLGRKLLIKRIISEQIEKLKIYYKSFNKLGLINELEEIIKELRSEKINPIELETFKNQLDDESMLRRKIEDILIIYENYERIVENGYIDESIKVRLFIENIDLITEFANSEIYILEFTGFSHDELEIIKVLEQKNNEITIALDYDEKYSDNIYPFIRDTLKNLHHFFGDLELVSFRSEMSMLNDFGVNLSLYEDISQKYPVKIFTGKNIYSEVNYVVGEINWMLLRGEISENEIGIMLTNGEIYGKIIKRQLDKFSLPYIMDEKRPIKDTNIVRSLMMLLQFYEKNFETQYLLKYLKYITPVSELEEIDILENYVISKGINYKSWENSFEELEIESIRKKYVDPLLAQKKVFKGNHSVFKFTEKLIELLNCLKIKEKIDREIEILKNYSRHEEVQILAQVWNRFLEIIDQMSEATSEEEVSLSEYIEYLMFSFENEEVGIIPSIRNGIDIEVMGRSVYSNKKVRFVLGMNEGNLPKDMSESSVLTESDKEIFLNHGFNLHNDQEFYRNKEKSDFFRMIFKTDGMLYLTLSSSNQEGKGIKPSYYITRARNIVENLVEMDDILNEDILIPHIFKDVNYFRIQLIRQLREIKEGKTIHLVWRKTLGKVAVNNNRMFKELVKHVFYTNQADNISIHNEEKIIYSSITKLEKYSQCAYSHFAQYELKLKERKEYKVTLPDIGNIYHEVLQIAVDDIISGKRLKLIDRYIEDVINKPKYHIFKRRYGDQYLIRKTKNTAELILNNLMEYFKNSNFNPKFTELNFTHRDELEKGVEPVEISLDRGKSIVVEGKIDRIDIYRDNSGKVYCNIVDYKTGSKDLKLDRILKGVDYQLTVYLLASIINSESMGVDEISPSGVLYYRIHNDFEEYVEKSIEDINNHLASKFKMTGLLLKDKSIIENMDHSIIENNYSKFIPVKFKKDGEYALDNNVLTERGFDNLIDITKKNIMDIGNKIMSGEIAINPLKETSFKACDYCHFNTVCKFDPDFNKNEYRYFEYRKNSEVIDEIGGESDD
ncbi:MAG: PD-(D/E)XK nuclease family protein [Clostridiales bacterium]|nr:PD-(D/E)XK nuclease family protein [Clostridiales bacterium]